MVRNPTPESGIASSLQVALRALEPRAEVDAVVVGGASVGLAAALLPALPLYLEGGATAVWRGPVLVDLADPAVVQKVSGQALRRRDAVAHWLQAHGRARPTRQAQDAAATPATPVPPVARSARKSGMPVTTTTATPSPKEA